MKHAAACYRARHAQKDAYNAAARAYKNLRGVDDKRDAFRHCVWSAYMTKRGNYGYAKDMGDAHEEGEANPKAVNMDQWNNSKGRDVGVTAKNSSPKRSDSWIRSTCKTYAENGTLKTRPF